MQLDDALLFGFYLSFEQRHTEFLISKLQFIEISKKGFESKEGEVCVKINFVTKNLLRCFYFRNKIEVTSWFMREADVIISVESFFKTN